MCGAGAGSAAGALRRPTASSTMRRYSTVPGAWPWSIASCEANVARRWNFWSEKNSGCCRIHAALCGFCCVSHCSRRSASLGCGCCCGTSWRTCGERRASSMTALPSFSFEMFAVTSPISSPICSALSNSWSACAFAFFEASERARACSASRVVVIDWYCASAECRSASAALPSFAAAAFRAATAARWASDVRRRSSSSARLVARTIASFSASCRFRSSIPASAASETGAAPGSTAGRTASGRTTSISSGMFASR